MHSAELDFSTRVSACVNRSACTMVWCFAAGTKKNNKHAQFDGNVVQKDNEVFNILFGNGNGSCLAA